MPEEQVAGGGSVPWLRRRETNNPAAGKNGVTIVPVIPRFPCGSRHPITHKSQLIVKIQFFIQW